MFRDHGRRLVLYASQWVRDRADAEDVVQDAFVNCYRRRIARVDEPLPYLYRAVRNAALNHRRSLARRERAERVPTDRQLFEEAAPGPEDDEFRARVEAALDALPAEQREALVLRVWGELTFGAIGSLLEIPVATAKSRYRYALDALRTRLAAEVEE